MTGHGHADPARETEGDALDASSPSPSPSSSAPAPRRKSRRGFASMDAEKQRAIASLGGKAAHQRGTAHEFTTEEAREAGRLGGAAAQRGRVARGGER